MLLMILPFIRGHCTLEDNLSQLQSTQKLNMSIYYEGLCPDSRYFITKVFYPNYKPFSESLNLHFIPFGKASIREDGSKYQCQHGNEECIRNIIQGCALDALNPGVDQVEFVFCAMANTALQGQKECTFQSGLSWEYIQNCMNGFRGLDLTLQAQYDTRTSTDGLKFVPTIVFNNKFVQQDQDEAFENPTAVICKYLANHPQC